MTKTVAFESPAFTTALAQVQTPLGVVKVLVRYIVICIKVLACVVVLKKKVYDLCDCSFICMRFECLWWQAMSLVYIYVPNKW